MSIRGQEEIEFGAGHFIGPAYGDETFVEIYDDPENPNMERQAELAAWANGCPVAQECIDPKTGRGPETMLNRYASLNFWFVHITEMASEHNMELHDKLIAVFPRRTDEPVGKYEPDSVPEDDECDDGYNYVLDMAPMGTLYGWALPRLLIKQIGDSESQEEAAAGRMTKGLSILEQAMSETTDPIVLLARFAEGISQADVPPKEVLQGTLSSRWLEEHNAVSMMDALKVAMQDHAPKLWKKYTDMDEKEKATLDIV